MKQKRWRGRTLTRIDVGLYEDDAGAMHLAILELLEASGFADTPANREMMTLAAVEVFRERYPEIDVEVTD